MVRLVIKVEAALERSVIKRGAYVSYLVLARKWRPTRFDDVVGQKHVTQTLQNAIRQQRVPHALLFIGSRGVGKTSCARIFAKALNCLSQPDPAPTPCDQCPSCESVNQGASVDVYEIDGASNNGVEQVRELRESTQFKPSISRFKIYIIDEVHMLSVGAFNALLKTLEEPPPHVKFIFATTEPHKIPDTIISRCQRFDFKRISTQDIVEALAKICEAEGVGAERAALEHVAREAQGGMRDSLSLLDQLISFCGSEITEAKTREVLGLTSREMMLELLGALYRQDPAEVISLLHEHAEAGSDLKRLASELLEVLRDLMVMKVHPDPQKVLQIPPSELDLMRQYSELMQVGALHHTFQTLVRSADDIQRSAYPKLLLEMTLLQMCHQADSATLSEVMGGLLQLETHLNEVGLGAGLPPLAPPPSYRPPRTSTGVYAAEQLPAPLPTPATSNDASSAQEITAPHQATARQSSVQEGEDGDSSGIPEAQPSATVAVPHAESPRSGSGRAPATPPLVSHAHSPSQTLPNTSSETSEGVQVAALSSSAPSPSSINTREMSTPHPDEAEFTTHIPRQVGGPRHPPLPFDVNRPPKLGDGVKISVYQWLSHFNQWLSQRDSFFASEMRVRSRVVRCVETSQGLILVFGGPPQLMATFQQRLDLIHPELVKSAHAVGTTLPQGQLRVEVEVLEDNDARWSIDSLSDHQKRTLALSALSQVEEATTSAYINQHLNALGGQVIYVIPEALQTPT